LPKNPKPLTTRQRFQETFGKPIEEYDSIKRATECVSEVTKQNYYKALSSYFLFVKQDPDSVLDQRKKDLNSENPEDLERYEKATIRYSNYLLHTKHYTGRGVSGVIGRIQGFFSNNSRRYSLDLQRKKLKLPKARRVKKYSPSNEEIRVLYSFAAGDRDRFNAARNRLVISIMSQNGLSPVDVSELNVGDLPKEPWSYYEKSRSKTGEVFRAVVTPDIARDLETYLEIRGAAASKDPLFVGRQGPLDNQAISQLVVELIKGAGLNGNLGFKPTSLRDAFEDALVSANVNHKIKETLMGHSSSIEHEYGGQNRLEAVCVQAMRKTFPLLSLNGFQQQEEKAKSEIEELKAKISKLEKARPTLEALLERLEELERKLAKQN
jgi:integrase